MKRFYAFFLILLAITTWIPHFANAQEEDWMPDLSLRQAVRQKLEIDTNAALTKADMLQLTALDTVKLQITEKINSLTGLEHAINLEVLLLPQNGIQDLLPLADLTKLTFLDLGGNAISDISPLARLVNLEALGLWNNQIVDVSPLARLMNLKDLALQDNQITDISPLVTLTSLRELNVNNNSIIDLSPLTELTSIEVLDSTGNPGSIALECELPRPSIIPRIEDREYPSVFGSWSQVINKPPILPGLEEGQSIAYFDLYFSHPAGHLGLNLKYTNVGVHLTGDFQKAKEHRDVLLAYNPNAMFLVPVIYYSGVSARVHPEDGVLQDLWLRDENGNRIVDNWGDALLDFTLPETQKWAIDQAKAIAACGLFDGIFLDHWSEGRRLREYRTLEAEHVARDNILQGIRSVVDDDFLIMVNTNEDKIPRWAEYVNGTYMETYPALEIPFSEITDVDKQYRNIGYSRESLPRIEETLIWSEKNFREPRINGLTGFGIEGELPDSPRNQQWMRVFTTLSLTHSDGYVEYQFRLFSSSINPSGGEPVAHWGPFWNAPLGRPVGEKGQLYKNKKGISIEGVFIREFTNGWAVYNRSGKEQTIVLSNQATGVTSGRRKNQHTLPDLDGEIYLKTVVQVAPGKHPSLYWTDAKTGTLHRLIGDRVENLVPEIQNATSLAVDAVGEKLYWTEKTDNRTGKIQSANLDGTNGQLVRNLTSTPLDLTLNTTSGKLYLSNAWGKIQRMNLDGSDFQPNLVTGLKTPKNLVLDTASGKLYWTEQISKTTGKVQRANLDGSNVQLVKKLTSVPRGMALDGTNRKLYLTNAWGKLQRMNLDGSNFQPNFITGLVSPGQVAVDVIGDKVYWTEKGKLRRANLDGGNIQDVVIGLGELTDIALGIDSMGQTGVAAAPATEMTVTEQTRLLANYPNPFNPETWIPYQLANSSDVQITIYDTRGSLVRCLKLGHQREGYYTSRSRAAYWDGRNSVGERVASGIYFYQLQADNVSLLRKMVILK